MITPGFYNFVTLESGGETHRGHVEVLEVEGHLIKVNHHGVIRILNTAASTFISATPVEPLSGDNPFADFE